MSSAVMGGPKIPPELVEVAWRSALIMGWLKHYELGNVSYDQALEAITKDLRAYCNEVRERIKQYAPDFDATIPSPEGDRVTEILCLYQYSAALQDIWIDVAARISPVLLLSKV